MKKPRSLSNARIPFWYQDIDYLVQGVEDVFNGLLQPFRSRTDDFIISGCEIDDTGSVVTMSGGMAYYEGEILPVVPFSIRHTNANILIKFDRVEGYDHAGDRPVYVGVRPQTHNAYKNDYLQPSLAGNTDTYRLAVRPGFWNLAERIRRSSLAADSGVVATQYPELSYRRVGAVVQLMGSMFNDALGGFNGEIAAGLPRPSAAMRFAIPGIPLAKEYLMLTTSGRLMAYTGQNRLYFDGITYLTTPVYDTNDGHSSTIANNNNNQQ